MRVVVFGNSVALRIRPPRTGEGERTYAERLREGGADVVVAAGAGVMLTEAFATLEDDVVARFPDWVIVNHGVVEACPRQTVRWINNRTIRNYYLNDRMGRPYIAATLGARLSLLGWRALNGGIRRLVALTGVRWHWTSRGQYLEVFERTLAVILRETSARIVVLGISPTSERVEGQLAGSQAAIEALNDSMRAACAPLAPRVAFLDPHQYLAGTDRGQMVPDGIHFSAEGHRRTAEAIDAVMRSAGGLPATAPH